MIRRILPTAALILATFAAPALADSCAREFDRCTENKCGVFADMAEDNAGTEAGSQQALVAGACLAGCASAKVICYQKRKLASKLCVGLACFGNK